MIYEFPRGKARRFRVDWSGFLRSTVIGHPVSPSIPCKKCTERDRRTALVKRRSFLALLDLSPLAAPIVAKGAEPDIWEGAMGGVMDDPPAPLVIRNELVPGHIFAFQPDVCGICNRTAEDIVQNKLACVGWYANKRA